jgi:hypothetical protein
VLVRYLFDVQRADQEGRPMIDAEPNTGGPWLLPHVGAGAACRYFGLTFQQTILLALAWEAAEAFYFEPRRMIGRESFKNRVSDVAANIVGFALADSIQ